MKTVLWTGILTAAFACIVCTGCGMSAEESQVFAETRTYLDNGGDPNAAKKYEWPRLHAAARDGYLEEVRLLISHGADVNAVAFGQTPLHMAAWGGNIEVVKLLAANGAKIDARDNWEITPLCLAAAGGRADVVTFLIANGADPQVKSKDNLTLMHWAAGGPGLGGWRCVKLAPYVAPGGLPTLEDVGGRNCGDSGKMIRMLAARGVAVDTAMDGGTTPLQLAAYCGNYSAFKTLMELGADVKVRTLERTWFPEHHFTAGSTILHVAAGEGVLFMPEDEQEKFLILIIDAGIDPNAKDADGCTPLHIAVKKGFKDFVRILLANGADPNAKAGLVKNRIGNIELKGCTPLHIAAGYDIFDGGMDLYWRERPGWFVDIAKILIDAGADINAEDADGYLPLDMAVKFERRYEGPREGVEPVGKMQEFLRSHGAEMSERMKKEQIETPHIIRRRLP